ncbi:MAG: DMT family transporter [Chloroflexi bacterium]|nr:DMT family transporter [Chloroflexota bacterium]
MGVLASLGAASSFAISSTFVASYARRLDPYSMVLIRMIAGAIFLVVALFVLGSQDDVARMGVGDLAQFIGAGTISMVLGEPLFIAAIAVLGLTRGFPTIMGLMTMVAYLGSVIVLGESVDWQVAVGSAMVLLGVYLVVLYGRAHTELPSTPAAEAAGAAERPISGAVPKDYSLTAPVRIPVVGITAPRLVVGLLLAMGVGLAWGQEGVWIRSSSEGFDAVAVHAVRVPVIAAIWCLIISFMPRSAIRRRAVDRRGVLFIAASGAISLGLSGILFIYAVQEIGAGPNAVLFATAPLFGLPLGAIFLKEKITIWVAIGTGIAVGGIALIA